MTKSEKTMAENKCSGDCLKCTMQQQIYCAAQRTYGMMKNQEFFVERIERIEASLAAFDNKPLISLIENEAQESPGADNKGQE